MISIIIYLPLIHARSPLPGLHHPQSCINEQLYTEMGDRLGESFNVYEHIYELVKVADGYASVGYRSVHVDDCWMSMQRDEQQMLTANVSRFPNGMKHLADYVRIIDRNKCITSTVTHEKP